MLVGSFSHLTRVDDDFICMLIKQAAEQPNAKEVIGGLWAFSEVADYQGRSAEGVYVLIFQQYNSALFSRESPIYERVRLSICP